MTAPAILALLLGAMAPANAPPEAGITVEASRLSREQARASSNDYVKAGMPYNPAYGQYARWQGPLCIGVRGIPDPAVAELVAARIRAAATQAGLALRGPGCRPNLLVAFTDDAKGLVDQVRSKKPNALPRFDPALFAGLRSASLPVRWWHVLAPAGGGGGAGTPDTGALASASSNGAPLGSVLPVGPDTIGTSSWNSSLIDTNLSIWVKAGVAVVDVNLAAGVSLEALADYAALVMLAPMTMPPKSPGVPSILSLFADKAAPPAAMSSWDKAFLKGLYSIQMNRSGQRQRQQLISAMAEGIAAGGDTPPQP